MVLKPPGPIRTQREWEEKIRQFLLEIHLEPDEDIEDIYDTLINMAIEAKDARQDDIINRSR